mmetsp:Transcript_6957/g.19628  ORF Transcript_6957/g.19628 Transcript_6957/m.19628 type:complete len:666 (+) Transcript_6957:957-2954(+)
MQVTQRLRGYYDRNDLACGRKTNEPITRPTPPKITGVAQPMLLSDVIHGGNGPGNTIPGLDGEDGLLALPPTEHTTCQWIVDSSQVQLNRRLAVGGFAEVFLGQFAGTRVAVKRLFSQTNHEEFRREIRMLAQLRHPNLLLFMGYTLHPSLSIITEYMQRGSLYNVISKKGHGPLDLKLQRSVAMSVARGMAYLHCRSPPILHLDLKSANILVDNAWRVKLGDFGLSRIRINSFMSSAASSGGTPQWMAPEVLRSERYDEAADVYSFGVVLWEVLTGMPPWADMHPMQVVGAVGFQGRSLPRPSSPDADPFLVELCMACMRVNPRDRPTFQAMVEALDEQLNFRAGSSSVSLSRVSEIPASPPALRSERARSGGDSQTQQNSSVASTPRSSAPVSFRTTSNASSHDQDPASEDEHNPSEIPSTGMQHEPPELNPKIYGLFREPSIVSPFAEPAPAADAIPSAEISASGPNVIGLSTAMHTPAVSPFEDGVGSPTAMAELSLRCAQDMAAESLQPARARAGGVAVRQESIDSPFLQADDSVGAASSALQDMSISGLPFADNDWCNDDGQPAAAPPDWRTSPSKLPDTVASPFEAADNRDVNVYIEAPSARMVPTPPRTPTQHPLRLQPLSGHGHSSSTDLDGGGQSDTINERMRLPSMVAVWGSHD